MLTKFNRSKALSQLCTNIILFFRTILSEQVIVEKLTCLPWSSDLFEKHIGTKVLLVNPTHVIADVGLFV